jgi:hypothetical protein
MLFSVRLHRQASKHNNKLYQSGTETGLRVHQEQIKLESEKEKNSQLISFFIRAYC